MTTSEAAAPFLSILVPARNEEAGLPRAVEVLLHEVDKLGAEAELLIVDDGSSDRTGAIADALAGQHPRVRAFHHPTNRGVGGALLTAIGQASGEWLILIPADLALDPAELSKFVDASAQADVVVGIRSDRSDYSFVRKLISVINICLIRILFHMRERQFNYISMYRLAVLREMQIVYWRSAFFHAEILIKARDLGRRLVEAEIRYLPRATGRASGARPALIVRTGWDMLHFWVRRLIVLGLGPGRRARQDHRATL